MWESIKNKFRRNKHIEEEQKIETENLQNEEVTNSEAEASLQSGETNANSDMDRARKTSIPKLSLYRVAKLHRIRINHRMWL